MLTQRDYEGIEAVGCLQSLAHRVWSPERRFHIGDIAWGWHSIPGASAMFRTSAWEDQGVVQACAWVELPGHLELVIDPAAAASVLPLVLDWFESVAAGPVRPDLGRPRPAGQAIGQIHSRWPLISDDRPTGHYSALRERLNTYADQLVTAIDKQ